MRKICKIKNRIKTMTKVGYLNREAICK